jgi:signal transduction histidine kinase/ActR/RegA family two-component response regulator
MTKRVPVRQRLFIVVIAAVIPLAVMSAVALYAGYEQTRKQVERAGLDVVRAQHTAVSAELRRTISVLQVLASSRALDALDSAAFLERSRQTLGLQSNWRAITLADAQGQVLLDTRLPAGRPSAPKPPHDPDSMRRVVATQAPVVGALARSPAGGWGIPVRVPVFQEGNMRYVLSAILDPDAILGVVGSQKLPGDWVVAVADARGNRVARTRSTLQSIGTPFSPTLVEMMLKHGDEGTGTTLNSEGDSVFTAWTRTGEFGWTTAVGASTQAVDAAARESYQTLGTGIILSTILGVIVAFFMARRIVQPIAQLREAAIAMERGGAFIPAPTDLQEIHDVSTTLKIAAQEQARARAEREELLQREQAARAAAEASNRAKDEFLAMLGHELRNPISAISNAATILGDPKVDDETAKRTRSIIARQVSHLARLTDDLLDAGRALMGKTVLRKHVLDLAAVASQAIATLRASHRLGNHRIVEDFNSVRVEADAIRLDQIVGNLIVNAVKYTPDGGTIRITVRQEGGEAVFIIADDGIGMEPDLVARAFDLFVQGSRELDRAQGGLGIGLTLVRRLAELHGGSATGSSEGLGKGSVFTVRLPVASAAAIENEPPGRATAARGRDILLVEDNEDARDTLRILLEFAGHRVDTAADGVAGLEKALALQPEVALVDVGLPRMDGYEVARRIRAHPGLRRPFLVALTGYGSTEDRNRAFDAGFDAHLVKPVDYDALTAMLSQAEAAIEPGQIPS